MSEVIQSASDTTFTRIHSARMCELDGLRGWAALSVVVYHMLWETFGVIHPGIRNPISAIVLDSHLAVSVFFVVSGAALSSSYFAGKGLLSTIKLAIKRYPRLVMPILAVSLVVLVVSDFGLLYNTEAATIVDRMDWLDKSPFSGIDLQSALQYSLFSVFRHEYPPNVVIGFLWTMRIELLGSLLVFALIGAIEALRKPKTTMIVLAALFLPLAVWPSTDLNQLSCFLAGMILANLRCMGAFTAMQTKISDPVVWTILFGIEVLPAVCHRLGIMTESSVIAVALVFFIFASRSACRFLSLPVSQILGRLSFPVYLVHGIVLVSLTSWLIVSLAQNGYLDLTVCVLIAFVSTVLSFVAAWLFLPVENATKFICNRLVVVILPLLPLGPPRDTAPGYRSEA